MQMLTIGPTRYDPVDQCLWRDGQRIELPPKTFAVLTCLVAKAGRLVTKEELIETVWPGVCVTDAVLKVRIADLRKRLCDAGGKPRDIETLHRRGYRLTAPVAALAADGTPPSPVTPATLARAHEPPACPAPVTLGDVRAHGLVGRDTCLAELTDRFSRAMRGQRQLVFVTGEAGAGKSALLDAFSRSLDGRADVRVATGRCVDADGSPEPFLPVLDALDALCRAPEEAHLPATLRRYAPTWLVQMPWLLGEADRERLAHELIGATHARMLREFGVFCESATRERTLVLVLEDLHWCDDATVELLSWIASQSRPAKLLILASARASEVCVSDSGLESLKRRLIVRDPCVELAIAPLGPREIATYLEERLPVPSAHATVAGWLHHRTGGNPLFMVNLVAYLNDRALLSDTAASAVAARLCALADSVPDDLKRMIAMQVEQLPPQYRELLLAASVAGDVFCAGVLGAALEREAEAVDELCRELTSSGRFIRHFDLHTLPDGRQVDRYAFTHVLYRDSLAQTLSARRRARWHGVIGSLKARVYAGSTYLIAAQLVTHFEQSGNTSEAIRFLQESAVNALARYSNRAAVCHLTAALALVDRIVDGSGRSLKLVLLEQRGLVHQAMADMRNAVVDFEQCLALARAQHDVEQEVSAQLRLASALSWTDRTGCLRVVDTARERAALLSPLSRGATLGACAYWNLLWRGWDDRDAADCALAVAERSDESNDIASAALFTRASYFRSLQGDYRPAVTLAERGMSIALRHGDGSEYLLALYFRSWALLHAGRWDELIDCLDEQAFRVADRSEHRFWHLLFTLVRSWLEAECASHDAAFASASDALARAERDGLPFGRLLGLVRVGLSLQALGRDDEAYARFAECHAWISRERVLMDWIVGMPLHQGLSRHWLREGNLTRARTHAESMLSLAAEPGERGYMASACEILASIALVQGDTAAAETSLERALRALNGIESPAAEWRVHAAIACLADTGGDLERAERHGTIAAMAVETLSTSLAARPALRLAFDDAQAVRAVRLRARPDRRHDSVPRGRSRIRALEAR